MEENSLLILTLEQINEQSTASHLLWVNWNSISLRSLATFQIETEHRFSIYQCSGLFLSRGMFLFYLFVTGYPVIVLICEQFGTLATFFFFFFNSHVVVSSRRTLVLYTGMKTATIILSSLTEQKHLKKSKEECFNMNWFSLLKTYKLICLPPLPILYTAPLKFLPL